MNYKYGITVARDSLYFMATTGSIKKRLADGMYYLKILTVGDAKNENIYRLRLLERNYRVLLKTPYNPTDYCALAEDFIELCTDIITDNSFAKALEAQ
jgi:hypothetical protein